VPSVKAKHTSAKFFSEMYAQTPFLLFKNVTKRDTHFEGTTLPSQPFEPTTM
jgi:hypothetical protein